MKVLLTGANGFVGSHVLDRLRAAGVATRLLLRAHSDTTFIQAHLPACEVVRGSLEDPAALARAVDGVTHVVHAAGATKALTPAGLYAANQLGTRHLVQALGRAGPGRRLILLSSLAVSGPGTRARTGRRSRSPNTGAASWPRNARSSPSRRVILSSSAWPPCTVRATASFCACSALPRADGPRSLAAAARS